LIWLYRLPSILIIKNIVGLFMKNNQDLVVVHSKFFQNLFVYKRHIDAIFNDILGLYEISHIAITRIDANKQLLTFSSTPALEFNLFTSKLWCFDKTYDPNWFSQCSQSRWESLYQPSHYHELYYIKQIKHHFIDTWSWVTQQDDNYYLYSIASNTNDKTIDESFSNHYQNLYKIGQYCVNLLNPLFLIEKT
jgi:hypothetical protein